MDIEVMIKYFPSSVASINKLIAGYADFGLIKKYI